MPGVAKEYRTLMYSLRENGDVLVHRLPFNANDKVGMLKLEKYLARGFTFGNPRKGKGFGLPKVIVTDEVNLDSPGVVSLEESEINEPKENQSFPAVVEPSTEQSPIKCSKCGKECKNWWGLEVHMRIHKKDGATGNSGNTG